MTRSHALAAPAIVWLLLGLCGAQLQESKPGLVELTADSFVSDMKALPEDRWVLAEFYAHWCPACQRFQPEYEKVAAYFAERGDKEPGVTVARLDCANHGALCGSFQVRGYPTMMLGTAADLAAMALDKLAEVQPASRRADAVIAWLAKHLDVTFDAAPADGTSGKDAAADSSSGRTRAAVGRRLDPGRGGAGGEQRAGGSDSGGALVDLNDVEGATLRSWQYIVDSPQLLRGAGARQGLKDWVGLLAGSHPVGRCRTGGERLQTALQELWPDDAEAPATGLAALPICPGSPFKDWRSCRGATPDARGYTCGLWQLLHSLAARLPEEENAGAVWLAAVKGFVGGYFQCSDCAQHFMAHAAQGEALRVTDKRSAALWLWRAHNIVNRRLAAEGKGEEPGSHAQFPPAELCAACRRAGGHDPERDEAIPWDEDEVYRFLLAFYSGEGGTSGAAGGSLRGRRSGWGDALLLAALVAGCVYGVLRHSSQYALRKAESRIL